MNSVISYLIYFLFFLVFTLAPIDIALNIKISGFNLRLGFLAMVILTALLGTLIAKDILLKKQKLTLPLYLILLLVVAVINLLFVPNSVYIPRGLVYALTLLLFVFLISFSVNTREYISLEKIVDIYVFSFLLHALLGAVQFILFYGFGINFFMMQLGRINGLTYEPSYYVTYLVPGTILITLMALFLNEKRGRIIFYSLTASLMLLVLIFSTSKLGIVESVTVILLAILVGAFLKLFKVLKEVNLKRNVSYFVAFTVFFAAIFYVSGNIGSIVNFLFPGKGEERISYLEKTEKVLASSKETSFDIRLSEFKETLGIALENPLLGKSLGGVAPYRALKNGMNPKNNDDVKQFEGMNIFAEMLAGFGIIGFLLMLGFIILISYDGVRLGIKALASNYKVSNYKVSIILIGLVLGFLLELFFLMFNQNVLRLYLWNHITLLALAIEKARYEYTSD
jgi:O-antigen ligase